MPVETFIDISNHQGHVDMAAVKKAGVTGVYAKATEGVSYTDPTFTTNRADAAAIGLRFGAYHFARPDANPATAEAMHFLNIAAPHAGELVPALDFETAPLTAAWAATFAEYVYKALGVYPLLYASRSYFDSAKLGTNATLRKCPIWVAAYSATKPSVPAGWPGIAMWQYTSSGTVPGVTGNCDKDHVYGVHVYQPPPPPVPVKTLIGYTVSYLDNTGRRQTVDLPLHTRLRRSQPEYWLLRHPLPKTRGQIVITRRFASS